MALPLLLDIFWPCSSKNMPQTDHVAEGDRLNSIEAMACKL